MSRQTFYKNPTIEFSVPDRGRVLLNFLATVKAAPHECVIRTGQP